MRRKQILVVEDNALNREVLSAILEESYDVLQAQNGQAALDLLRKRGEEISLILLDVMMPVMDGYSLLDIIREDPELSLIPVIVTTQSNSEEDEVAALSHGATDFVPKPYRPQVILHRAASLIKLRESAAIVNLLQYDRLTGVYTKEFFYRKLRERLDANPDKRYCIVCVNVENFKLFNDTFGAREGDRLLVTLADILREMAGEDGFCGRFDADRFLFLQEASSQWITGEGKDLEPEALNHRVVLRWGVYEITDRTVQVEQMCDRVLLAVGSIRGKYNQFLAVYDDALRAKLLREQAITDAMEPALQNEEFVVYLQPKYSLKHGCIAGAEALARWIHPKWGFMSPGEFIPLFEKNGFIPRLDQYMWEKTCQLLGQWKKDGHPMIPISVNISRADIYQQDLVKAFTGLVKKYGVDPRYLHLEITESAYVDNANRIVTTLKELRQRGFPIEMDDFGSGYSSLNMLGQLRLDILKLDMQFVCNETGKPEVQSILGDIVAMGHRLHLGIVAEGAETRGQVDRLKDAGCDYVQGYFFAKPMPLDQFEAHWKARGYACVPPEEK